MGHEYIIRSPLAVLVVLTAVTAGFLYAQQRTKWRLWAFFPPLHNGKLFSGVDLRTFPVRREPQGGDKRRIRGTNG